MISQERLQKALGYLAETDQEFARTKAYSNALSEQRKTVKAQCYLSAAGTGGERSEKAYAHNNYIEHLVKMHDAELEYETLRNKRLTESTIIEVWRSLNAARRAGQI